MYFYQAWCKYQWLASILLEELVAIEIDFTLRQIKKKGKESVKIFCDSQSVLGFLTLGWTLLSDPGTINQMINRSTMH